MGDADNEGLFSLCSFSPIFLELSVNRVPFLVFNTITCFYIYLLRSQRVITSLHFNKTPYRNKIEFIK